MTPAQILFYAVQFTWGLPVNLAGLLAYLLCRGRYPQEGFRWARVTCLPGDRGGLSLGIFLFVSASDGQAAQALRAHEYGHTFQCLLLGPLYWAAVVLPSALWYHFLSGPLRRRGVPYDALYCERWATAWGRKLEARAPGKART